MIIKRALISGVTGLFLIGCAPAPIQESAIDMRPKRYAYGHVATSISDPLLPPPHPNEFFGDVENYRNPQEPYLDDLMEYQSYVKRYINHLRYSIGKEIIAIVQTKPKCGVSLSDITIPNPPKKPHLESLETMEEIATRYYDYSEALLVHLKQVRGIYERLIEQHRVKCDS